jgi:8-oxo-dGTP diphosphatase
LVKSKKRHPHLWTCRTFIVKNGKTLILRRSKVSKNRAGLWECPGGKARTGQSFAASLAREVLEETGFSIENGRVLWSVTRTFTDGTRRGQRSTAQFTVHHAFKGAFELSSEHDAYAWVTYEELMAHKGLVPEVRRAAKHLRKRIMLRKGLAS